MWIKEKTDSRGTGPVLGNYVENRSKGIDYNVEWRTNLLLTQRRVISIHVL